MVRVALDGRRSLSLLPCAHLSSGARADGRMPAASSAVRSGTPVHCAIADQPSSQVRLVICVRAGMRFRSASEKLADRATRPSTRRRPSATRSARSNPVSILIQIA